MTDSSDIEAAVARLTEGRLVAFPTETVYGLGADVTNPAAIERVFAAKGRPGNNPLIVHVSDAEMAQRCVSSWPGAAEKAAAAFWPGPLTLVLPRSDLIPSIVTGGGETVAVRAPDHPVTIALIEAFGGPVVGPSANPSGYISPTRASHVRQHFGEHDILILDGGPCRAGIESTVLDLSVNGSARILRRGVLGVEDLEPVIGAVTVSGEETKRDEVASSPGLVGPHYQPRAPVLLLEDVTALSRVVADAGGRVALLSPPGRRVVVSEPHLGINMPGLASAYGARLYAALREADESEPALIVVVFPLLSESEIWDAIRERLRRAAAVEQPDRR